jgi:hypothetical protein
MIMGANNGGCFNQADLDTLLLVCAIWVSTRPGSHDHSHGNIKLLTDYHSRRRDNFIYSPATYTHKMFVAAAWLQRERERVPRDMLVRRLS